MGSIQTCALGHRAEHTIAITPEDVISWGANDRGQCGQGERSETDWVKPRSLKPLQQADVSQVVCGRTHTLCVTTTSQVRQHVLMRHERMLMLCSQLLRFASLCT